MKRLSAFRHRFGNFLDLSFREAIEKISGKFRYEMVVRYDRVRDRRLTTFEKAEGLGCISSKYFPAVDIDRFLHDKPRFFYIVGLLRSHYFNLLGSGWIQVKHGIKCKGLKGHLFPDSPKVFFDNEGEWLVGRSNPANLSESKRIWQLIDVGYCPIDWQLDFKSGYRWSERTWYKDIGFGEKLGVDIKVPWELARMQYLIQFVWAYILVKNGMGHDLILPEECESGENGITSLPDLASTIDPKTYIHEFRNQILDFIATNPPRFGVNWACTMDVAIRVSNWLVAYDLFRMNGAKFDEQFEQVFSRSVYEHGKHIINNLEWNGGRRSNHYLANISGLVFVTSYLKKTSEICGWADFSISELIREVKYQFNEDGSNFESSTAYHRLSAEFVIYATALALKALKERLSDSEFSECVYASKKKPGLPQLFFIYKKNLFDNLARRRLNATDFIERKFPQWYFDSVEKMCEFVVDISKPNGRIPQIGDNDSGRFFKFVPFRKDMPKHDADSLSNNPKKAVISGMNSSEFCEDHLDCRHLVGAINGLFHREDFLEFAGNDSIDYYLVRHLTKEYRINSNSKQHRSCENQVRKQGGLPMAIRNVDVLSGIPRIETSIPLASEDIAARLKLFVYPDFGIYIFKSERLFLAVRCKNGNTRFPTAHCHNDNLSIELNIDCRDLITDPGSFVYTPLPEVRNQYRSVKAHFAPVIRDYEPGRLDIGLFTLQQKGEAKCLYCGIDGFLGMHTGFGIPVYRVVRILHDSIQIVDLSEGYGQTGGHNQNGAESRKLVPISLGYGVLSSSLNIDNALLDVLP